MLQKPWQNLTEPLTLSSDTINIIRIPLAASDSQLDRLRGLLSPDESARADRYKAPQPKRHFIVCRGMLRTLLASCLHQEAREIEFVYGDHGKPSLKLSGTPTNSIEFSVSHSSDQALIAITKDRRLGVDIERIDPAVRILKLATRFFSPRESAELLQLPEADQLSGFYRGWTSKESYLKATGFGLSFPLSKFTVSLNPHREAELIEVVDRPEELQTWVLRALDPLPEFAAAIIVESRSSTPIELRQYQVTDLSAFIHEDTSE